MRGWSARRRGEEEASDTRLISDKLSIPLKQRRTIPLKQWRTILLDSSGSERVSMGLGVN